MYEDDRDPLIADVSRALREPVSLDSAFDARVAAAVRREHGGGSWKRRMRWHGIGRWLVRPRAISPLAVLAGALLLCVATAALTRAFVARGTDGAPASLATDAREVRFVLLAPSARAVSVAGDFNDWNVRATPLHRSADGVWTVTVPLRPGAYSYSFVVDGQRWVPDPLAPPAARDDFGKPSSMILVRETTS